MLQKPKRSPLGGASAVISPTLVLAAGASVSGSDRVVIILHDQPGTNPPLNIGWLRVH